MPVANLYLPAAPGDVLKLPIMSVEVTWLIHATEDESKVEGSVRRLLGGEPAFGREVLEGHFGNKIVKIRVHLTGDKAASAFQRIVSSLAPQARGAVARELEAHVDEHSALFLRLDKQGLVSGSPRLGTADAVRVKVKPRLHALKGGALEFYARELEGA